MPQRQDQLGAAHDRRAPDGRVGRARSAKPRRACRLPAAARGSRRRSRGRRSGTRRPTSPRRAATGPDPQARRAPRPCTSPPGRRPGARVRRCGRGRRATSPRPASAPRNGAIRPPPHTPQDRRRRGRRARLPPCMSRAGRSCAPRSPVSTPAWSGSGWPRSGRRRCSLAVLVMAGVRALTGPTRHPADLRCGPGDDQQPRGDEADLPRRRATTLLMLGPAAVAVTAGTLLAPHRLVADVVFVGVTMAAVYVRRFGPRGFALGMAGFMPYFFTQFLQARPAELPWLLVAAVVRPGCDAAPAGLRLRRARGPDADPPAAGVPSTGCTPWWSRSPGCWPPPGGRPTGWPGRCATPGVSAPGSTRPRCWWPTGSTGSAPTTGRPPSRTPTTSGSGCSTSSWPPSGWGSRPAGSPRPAARTATTGTCCSTACGGWPPRPRRARRTRWCPPCSRRPARRRRTSRPTCTAAASGPSGWRSRCTGWRTRCRTPGPR